MATPLVAKLICEIEKSSSPETVMVIAMNELVGTQPFGFKTLTVTRRTLPSSNCVDGSGSVKQSCWALWAGISCKNAAVGHVEVDHGLELLRDGGFPRIGGQARRGKIQQNWELTSLWLGRERGQMVFSCQRFQAGMNGLLNSAHFGKKNAI
jgi:hypothetical protein